ncbi:Na/Pi cotransporter family protein [Desemzia sp. RIT804]|uniref:Na/Pi cotransporter family protein n=1 Tax=Desemzia sp. RIT 804 TaxID=2810209 RepID=UPI0019512630|nr:Na/Pi cotransporter family protein [Desemzia sp. RIT 804]MBM6615765.1 Na/Pi cotransporter family protein [Desemzia sp. RIT 804]
MDIQEMLFQFFGGLGIFLFGLKYMGDGLQRSAGDNLRDILNTFTSTPLRAILAGIVVTALIQSSSGTTVLAVGLVSAGFMTLKQAIGVIMGANVGTTVTAFIIGIDIGAYALPILAVGALLLFFFKKPSINSMGQIIFGFGALFYGLELMGSGMAPLENLPQFRDLMMQLSDNPFLGVFAGTGLTLVLQSSSATIGILQELYAHGSIALEGALPVLFGNNIGTTITAILAAIGTSVAAKRTAASHVIFNLVGTVLVMLVLHPFTEMIIYLGGLLNLNPEMQLAFAHGLFNIANVLIQMWFINQIADVVCKIVPNDESELSYENSHLDQTLIQSSPAMALNQAKNEVGQMGQFVLEEFHEMFSYYRKQDEKSKENTMKLEEIVNQTDIQITEYLMLLSNVELPLQNTSEHVMMMEITKYLERIGDHCESILKNVREAAQAAKKNKKSKKNLDNTEREKVFYDPDLVALFKLVQKNVEDAVSAYKTDSFSLAGTVIQREKEVNKLEYEIREKYIERLNNGVGIPSDGILFVDIVSNLERISDHSVKIAKHTLGIRYPHQQQQKGLFIKAEETATLETV